MTHEELIKTAEYKTVEIELCLFNMHKHENTKKKAKKHSKYLIFASGHYDIEMLKNTSEIDFIAGYTSAIEDIAKKLNLKIE